MNALTGDELDALIMIKAENVLKGFSISAVNQVENLICGFEDQSYSMTIRSSTILVGGAISLETGERQRNGGGFLGELPAVSSFKCCGKERRVRSGFDRPQTSARSNNSCSSETTSFESILVMMR